MKKLITLLVITVCALTAISQNTFLKSYSYWDRGDAETVFEDTDGYIIAGCGDKGTNGYLFLLKTDFLGDTIWTKNFLLNKKSVFIDDYAVDETGNKLFIVSQIGGEQNIFKFDETWNLLYNGSFGLISPYKIKILNDNNYLIITKHANHYNLHKINSENLSEIWIGDTLKEAHFYNIGSIIERENGEIVILTKNIGVDQEEAASTVFHLNQEGKIITQFSFVQFVLGTTKFENGNLISLTYRDLSESGYNEIITYQLDGLILSTSDITTNNVTYRKYIDDNDKQIMLGRYFDDEAPISYTTLGCFNNNEKIWAENHSDAQTSTYFPSDIMKASDNGYLVVGTKSKPNYIPYLLKTDSLGKISPLGLNEVIAKNNFKLYPNPATEFINLVSNNIATEETIVELYNSSGLLLSTSKLSYNIRLNIKNLANGVYFIKVKTFDQIEVFRFIKV